MIVSWQVEGQDKLMVGLKRNVTSLNKLLSFYFMSLFVYLKIVHKFASWILASQNVEIGLLTIAVMFA